MTGVYIRWIWWLLAMIVTAPVFCFMYMFAGFGKHMLYINLLTLSAVAFIIFGFNYLMRTRRFAAAQEIFDQEATKFSEFVQNMPMKYVGPAIFASAGIGLYIELCLIRWQGTVFEVFSFYKNFSLLACFAGLGLGYALSGRKQLYLIATLPLL
ncbi:MAG TPA: hypothetical protein V6C72_17960, partial [Chroococcales cyanobacterium]